MDLESYVGKKENVICSANVKQERGSGRRDTTSGSLAVTNHRLVYLRGNRVVDVSLDGITAMVFSPRTFLNKYTIYGIGLLFVAVVTWFAVEASTLRSWLLVVPVVVGLVALGYLWEGIVNRFARIEIHTPTDSYTFLSKDGSMEKMTHAVRQARA